MSNSETVGFIGTGVMGRSMAGHLLDGGYSVSVFNRTKVRADSLLEKGAVWKDSPGEVAAASSVVITIVGFPIDVEAVYLGENGIVDSANSGSLLIDMTTSSPVLAGKISDAARAKGVDTLDAPVSGGDIGAREARLSIMVGGEQSAFDRAKPLFDCMGKNIILMGPAGSGQHTKMSNQIAIASGMVGICESMIYAKKSGLDPSSVVQCIESGAAGSWSLSNLAPRFLKGNFDPGFFVKHFIKDMKIAIEVAEEMNLDLPGLSLAKKLYDQLASEGGEDFGTQALYKIYDH